MDKYSNNCKFKMLISSNIIDIDQKALNSFYTSLNLSNMILERFNDKIDFKNIKSVFEPCCGSGSLILSLQKYNMNMNITANEINIKLKIFHELFNNVDFYYCDIFEQPKYLDKKFDLIYMNPPFNISSIGDNNKYSKSEKIIDIHFVDFCQENFLNNNGYLIAICSTSVLNIDNNKYK